MSLSFDATYYQTTRPDVFNAFVATAGSTGLTWAQFAEQHYDTFGRFEGSNPSASFDTNFYLSTYPDVAAAGVNPFDHFLTFGSLENRQPFSGFPNSGNGFDAAAYAAANTDLAAAGITTDAALYQHFVVFGQFESRPGTPTVNTPNDGSSFTLTTGVDAITGTTGDDTITGGALAPDGVAAATTLNPLDTIDGGDGTDTLVLDTTGNQNQTIQGTITNVENLTFAGSGAAIPTVDATQFSGTIKWSQTADTAFAVTGATGQTFVLDRVADTTTATIGYGAAQTSAQLNVDSPVGDATFSVSGTGLTTVNSTLTGKTATGKGVTVTDTGNTTTAFNLNTDADNTVTITSAGLKTVTVAGAGKVSLTTTTAPTTSVDASGNTGGLTLATALATGTTFTGGAGGDTVTQGASTVAVAMGAGDDSVTWTAAALGNGGSTDGGDGTDTLNLTAANLATATSNATLGAAFQASISNFEKIGVGATGAATVVDAQYLDGITNIQSAGTGGGFTLTVNNMVANSTFGMSALAAAGGNIALNYKDSSGTSDVLNLEFSATDGFINVGTITAAGIETLNITTDDTDTTAPTTVFTAPITATSATTVNVTGDVGINLTGLTATTLTTLDASGVTASGAAGAVTLTTGALAAASTLSGGAGNDVLNAAAAVEAVTLNGNGGNDTLTGSSTKANTINGGEGNDTIVGGAAVDTINGGAGNDNINSGAGLDIIDVGTGTDTFVVTANANGNTYADLSNMGSGDSIDFLAGSGVNAFVSTGITLGGTAAFADFLNAAAAGGADRVSWFQFGGDTYLVQDVSAGAVFQDGADQVVKLTGLVDLSTATIDGAVTNILTLG